MLFSTINDGKLNDMSGGITVVNNYNNKKIRDRDSKFKKTGLIHSNLNETANKMY